MMILTSDSAVRHQDELVLGRLVARLHVVDLGVDADALAAKEHLEGKRGYTFYHMEDP